MGEETRFEPSHAVGEARHGRGRLVAVATVLTTLAAAATAYMQADALKAHDEADIRAERLGALAETVATANREHAAVQMELLHGLRQAEAIAGSEYGKEADRSTSIADAIRANTTAITNDQSFEARCSWQRVVCEPESAAAIARDPAHASSTDSGYEERTQWESYRLDAERAAADSTAEAAESRFAHLAAALTMLTVAVFLFGYSLTPQGRERRGWFLAIASGFLVFGVAWSLSHALRGYHEPDPAAARAYADGVVARHNGQAHVAIRDLERATRSWSRSSLAYGELALAQFDGARGYDRSTLKKAISSDERSRALGSSSPTVEADLGADLLLLGISGGVKHDGNAIARARALSLSASHRFERQIDPESRHPGEWLEHPPRGESRHPGPWLAAALFTVAETDLVEGSASTRHDYCLAIRTTVAMGERFELEPRVVLSQAKADIELIDHDRRLRAEERERTIGEIGAAVHRPPERCPSPPSPPPRSEVVPAVLR